MLSRGTINKQRNPACREENSTEAQSEAKGKDHTAQERRRETTQLRESESPQDFTSDHPDNQNKNGNRII